MPLIETESLILKCYGLREADKIVVFLARNEGLMRGVARGAKRLKSRFGASLEPFSIVDLTYFQKEERELVTIDQLYLKESFFAQAASPDFLQKFSYLAELLIEFAPPNEPNERLYRMARVCLETAVKEPGFLENITLYFELWILRLAGYLPDWHHCFDCKRELNDDESTNLQVNFHLLCLNCQKSSNNWRLSPMGRHIFLLAQTAPPDRFVESTIDKQPQVKEISLILKRVISHVLGRETVGERISTASLKN